MRDSINELLEEARQLEDKKQFAQARDKYAVVRGELADEIDKGELARVDEFVIAVIGEQVCDMADHLSRIDLTFRRRSLDFQRNISELKKYVETAAHGNLHLYLNALATAFKRDETLFMEERWVDEAITMSYERLEVLRKLASRSLLHKFSGRSIKGVLIEFGRAVFLRFLWLICGYGEKPWRLFLSTLVPILIFALTASTHGRKILTLLFG